MGVIKMKQFKLLVLLLVFFSSINLFAEEKNMSIYDFNVKTIDGKDISLSRYKGEVLLIVNVASKCGFTPQYKGLEALYEEYHSQKFMVLGFPSNQFLSQEPESNEKIKFFCHATYDVKFDMFAKIDVNGDDADPLYKFLKEQQGGFLWIDSIKWNFTKFLVDREGNVVKRYAPSTEPQEIKADIEKLLK
jgi:glutathione peroxidase